MARNKKKTYPTIQSREGPDAARPPDVPNGCPSQALGICAAWRKAHPRARCLPQRLVRELCPGLMSQRRQRFATLPSWIDRRCDGMYGTRRFGNFCNKHVSCQRLQPILYLSEMFALFVVSAVFLDDIISQLRLICRSFSTTTHIPTSEFASPP
jgi:hypothetical protein